MCGARIACCCACHLCKRLYYGTTGQLVLGRQQPIPSLSQQVNETSEVLEHAPTCPCSLNLGCRLEIMLFTFIFFCRSDAFFVAHAAEDAASCHAQQLCRKYCSPQSTGLLPSSGGWQPHCRFSCNERNAGRCPLSLS